MNELIVLARSAPIRVTSLYQGTEMAVTLYHVPQGAHNDADPGEGVRVYATALYYPGTDCHYYLEDDQRFCTHEDLKRTLYSVFRDAPGGPEVEFEPEHYGYFLNDGTFVTQAQAMVIAEAAGQTLPGGD